MNCYKKDFCGENIRRLLASATKDTTPQNFAEKTFANRHKTSKFVKVFFLTSFPLNSVVLLLKHYTIKFHVDDLTEEGLMKLWFSRKDNPTR